MMVASPCRFSLRSWFSCISPRCPAGWGNLPQKEENPRPFERRPYIYRKKITYAILRLLRAASPAKASRESVAVVGSGTLLSQY